MRKTKKITSRRRLNKGDRVFSVNHMIGPYGLLPDQNDGKDYHATVLRKHRDPRYVVVRFDYDQSVQVVDWRTIYKSSESQCASHPCILCR